MRRHRVQTLMSSIGVLLVIASVALFVRYHDEFWAERSLQLSGLTGFEIAHTCGSAIPGQYRVRVQLQKTFILELSSHDAATLSRQYRLSGIGLEIQPTDWLPLAVDAEGGRKVFRAKWSARAMTPGEYYPILNVKSSDGKAAEWMGGCLVSVRSEIDTVQGRVSGGDFRVLALPTPVYYIQKFSPYLGSFLGSLMTLPGILAFLKNRREDAKHEAMIKVSDKFPS